MRCERIPRHWRKDKTNQDADLPIKLPNDHDRIRTLLDAIENGQDPADVQTILDRQEQRARSSVQNVRDSLQSLATCNGWRVTKIWETKPGGYLDTVEKIDLFVRVVFPDGHSQDMKIQVKSSRTGEEEFQKKNPQKKDICVINGQQTDAEIQQVFTHWVERGGR